MFMDDALHRNTCNMWYINRELHWNLVERKQNTAKHMQWPLHTRQHMGCRLVGRVPESQGITLKKQQKNKKKKI